MEGNRDYKKLFSRDRIFLLCLTGVVALVLLYGLAGCYRMIEIQKFYVDEIALTREEFSRKVDLVMGLWGTTDVDIAFCGMFQVVCGIVMAAQIGKWYLLEGRHGKEFGKLLPIKSGSYITYDYMCGILYIWGVAAISWLAVRCYMGGMYDLENYIKWMFLGLLGLLVENSFLYVMLVFAGRITNNMPGRLLTFFVICFGLYIIQWNMQWDTGGLYFFLGGWGIDYKGTAILTVLMISGAAASYACDKKRDIAGNGTFSFAIAHYLVLGALFLELAVLLSAILKETEAGEIIGVAAGVLLSGAVAFGVHYIAKPKKL